MKSMRPALIALTAALALGVTACGSADDSDDTAEDTTTSSARATSEASASEDTSEESPSEDSSTATSSTSADSADDGGLQAVLDAIEVAEKETDGTAYEVDDQDDDGTWEIDIAKGDRSIEVEVGEDGSASTDDDDDRAGIKAAKITVGDAIEAALEEVDGTFDDAELEEENGTHFWEVTIDAADDDDVEVHVDVTDGTATVEKDDDNGDD